MIRTPRMSPCGFVVVIGAMAFTLFAHALSAETTRISSAAEEGLIGACGIGRKLMTSNADIARS